MSTVVGTSRASRTNKDKNAKSTANPVIQTTQSKTDRPPAKIQATVEQIRMAQMIDSGKETTDIETVRQLSEMTGRPVEDVVVALHDAQDDPNRAVMILLEGKQDQWEEQGKKKKKTKSDKETPPNNPENDRVEDRQDRSHDNQDHTRHDIPPRRGRDRRNGVPPPRLARGRGRERNNFSGNRDRSNFNGEREEREDWDGEGGDDREKRRDRGIDSRGRGRGRGGFRRGGRGNRPQRFERQTESSDGPHIDTWTNETAENAEKENNTGWGESWSAENYTEDWSEDQWTGSLDESKVFTSTQTKSPIDSDVGPALNDSTNTLGQRLDVGSLFSKSAEFAKAPDFTKTDEMVDPFISQYNQQATESIKNSIGIGSSSRQNMPSISCQSQPQHQSQPLSPLSPLSSMPQREIEQMVRGSIPSPIPPNMLPPATTSSLQSQHHQQQRPRPQRSKLPPPSKIPASAVEMPGHMMPQLDVQFGVDFGTESQFGFGSGGGGGDNNSVNVSYPSSPPTSSVITNHLGKTTKPSSDVSRQSSVLSSPSKPQQSSSLSTMEASPARPSVFPNSIYTTPTKLEVQSKGSESIPFPVSPTDHKSSTLIGSQRTTQSPSVVQASKPDTSSQPGYSAANGYSSATFSSHGNHKTTGLSTGASTASQTFSHTAVTSQPAAPYQNQYGAQASYVSSQTSQFQPVSQPQYSGREGQYATGSAGLTSQPNQYLQNQSQFQSRQSEFQSVPASQSQFQPSGNQFGGYQASTAFQGQSGISSSGNRESAQNSLYQTSPQQPANSYSSGSGSFHVRDSQSSSTLQQSSNIQSNNAYQTQPSPAGAPGLKVTTTQSPSGYTTQTYSTSHSSQHPQSLQTSPLSNKLGDSLSKMTLKDSSLDGRQPAQYEHGNVSATTASIVSTVSTSSISTVTSTVSAMSTPMVTSSTLTSRVSSTLPVTTKAPPNLPPGVPLLNPHQYMIGQAGTLPPYYGLQQPLYGYEDLQMLQQRLSMQTANPYYDMNMSAFPTVTSTISGRDQATLGTSPYTGTGTDNKQLNRVEAQSPNSSTQQQSTHSAPQPYNIHYGFFYPGAVLPAGAPSFQYPTMFGMPPVTNTPAPHIPGTTATANQLPKNYGSHQGYVAKGYEDVSGAQELTKQGYGGVQQQAKVAGGSRMSTRAGNTADINTAAYTKTHTQGFDKQGFPGGTPPPFSLPLASGTQAGPLGAPAAPYGTPYLPMMPPQAHNQTILHHTLQQDSAAGSAARSMQQPTNQGKSGAAKPYGAYWPN